MGCKLIDEIPRFRLPFAGDLLPNEAVLAWGREVDRRWLSDKGVVAIALVDGEPDVRPVRLRRTCIPRSGRCS